MPFHGKVSIRVADPCYKDVTYDYLFQVAQEAIEEEIRFSRLFSTSVTIARQHPKHHRFILLSIILHSPHLVSSQPAQPLHSDLPRRLP